MRKGGEWEEVSKEREREVKEREGHYTLLWLEINRFCVLHAYFRVCIYGRLRIDVLEEVTVSALEEKFLKYEYT